MSYLYIIRNGIDEIYKIGIAVDVEQRLASLQTGNPKILSVHLCRKFQNAHPVELSLHQTYSRNRISGEWFELDYQKLQEIEMILNLLGGEEYNLKHSTANDEEVAEQEHLQEAGERVAQYIEHVRRTENRTPGQSEIARAVGVSKSTADTHLKRNL